MSSFDKILNRRSSESAKWNCFDEDVLPMWVADMDFQAPPAVIEALQKRIDHGIFGYPIEMLELKNTIIERMDTLYNWKISPEDLVFTSGVVSGFNLACQALYRPDGNILIQPPVYPPFLHAAHNAGMDRIDAELTRNPDGSYQIDMVAFEKSFRPNTVMFLLCNPHNPVGRVFTRSELEQMAQICLSKGVVICSDEIHCDFIFSGHQHIPIASLSPEIAQNTITLMAPSKTYNIAGLDFAFAIIPNAKLKEKFIHAFRGITGSTNLFGQIAALAAFQHGDEWLKECIAYLEANRDFLVKWIRTELPMLGVTVPESTFLAWIDCRNLSLKERPAEFFLQKARIALNAGEEFGKGGDGFVRLNYGCPRSILEEGLHRIEKAIKR
jgi:cystathionine beta-lyase